MIPKARKLARFWLNKEEVSRRARLGIATRRHHIQGWLLAPPRVNMMDISTNYSDSIFYKSMILLIINNNYYNTSLI